VTACARSGCDGVVEADGYCNVCGLAPVGGSKRVAEGGSATGSGGQPLPKGAPAGVGRCERSGCDGAVEADGYCNVCGLAPVGGSKRVAADPIPAAPLVPPVVSVPTTSRGTSTIRRFATPSGTTSQPSAGGSGSGGSRGNLGAGLVEMPAVATRDPHDAVLTNPEVPERKRYCARCNHPVGRSRGARGARTEGFCPHCGGVYSFTPKLWPGDLVGGQYQVAGCIAHGGLGWIYLAQDKNVEDSWVVLKGLLDSGDESAMLAAATEKRFLAEVRHPNIVRIYNFVEHGGAGYIVMEYVGGESLRELRVRHREETGVPLPVDQAIAYVLEILPALGFLHRRGLLFCDFKPDNVIQTEEQLTLIDLGGVRRMDDQDSDLYGTIGYQAPEVPERGASIASDLYTVARTLAILSIEFAGFQDEKRYATSLPPVQDVPEFQRYESFHRFLQKATAAEPDLRFQSAAGMAEQLVGVLRQVVATDGGRPATAPSALFSAELGSSPDEAPWQLLPIPAVDANDPAAGVLATLALVGADQRQALVASTPRSAELSLNIAKSAIEDGAYDQAARELESPEARGSGWRAAWWRGVLHMAEGRPSDGLAYFAAVAAELPGELAPKLAMAASYEEAARTDMQTGSVGETASADVTTNLRAAARSYALVAATDPSYATASFGLARISMELGDREAAAAALQRVPKSSSAYVTAQVASCRVLCVPLPGDPPTVADLAASSVTLAGLSLENSVRLPLLRDLHLQALAMLLEERVAADDDIVFDGAALNEEGQRGALEHTYRSLAKLAPSEEERWELVDLANAYRPRTLT
jgi:serine/threonine-protein kinase PknG